MWNFRAKCKIIQSYWKCALTACTGEPSMECSPAVYSLALQDSGSPCFLQLRWAPGRHLIPPSEVGLSVIISCYHKTKPAPVLQTPNMCSIIRFAGSTMWLLGRSQYHPYCTVWGPCTINVPIILLRSAQVVSLHNLPPAVRKVLMPSAISDSRNSSDSKSSHKLFLQDLTNTHVPTIYT